MFNDLQYIYVGLTKIIVIIRLRGHFSTQILLVTENKKTLNIKLYVVNINLYLYINMYKYIL